MVSVKSKRQTVRGGYKPEPKTELSVAVFIKPEEFVDNLIACFLEEATLSEGTDCETREFS